MEPIVTTLPEDFDGTFRFTNPSDEDFIGKWGGKAYTYPAMRTTPMIIVDATPLEIQSIRKKFAKELAEREFFKSDKATRLTAQEKNIDGTPRFNSFQQAGTYVLDDLKDYIQKCLEPLPLAKQTVVDSPKKNIEDDLTRDEDGELNTEVVRPRQALKLKNKEAKTA